uniref:NADH-ubiquinone oxidoreductase chain 6 n=1 Tax=Euplectus karstenii TaxID=878009 RepID=A0A0M3LUW8_9COLE|nr:NADH dehydrogenase subunit 6 [Euplectus karstenii]
MLMMNFILTMMFLFLKHPLSMGLNLFIQTINISLMTGNFLNNFWFSYILFLIFIGGMLILFMYMISIASNEMFKTSKQMIFFSMMLMFMLITIFLLMDHYFINFLSFPENIINNKNINHFFNKFYNYPNNLIIFSMIIYLFITLIASVKITSLKYGPIRQKF